MAKNFFSISNIPYWYHVTHIETFLFEHSDIFDRWGGGGRAVVGAKVYLWYSTHYTWTNKTWSIILSYFRLRIVFPFTDCLSLFISNVSITCTTRCVCKMMTIFHRDIVFQDTCTISWKLCRMFTLKLITRDFKVIEVR